MTAVFDRARALLDNGRSAMVLGRSGLIEYRRPDRIIKAVSDIRSLGPIAGPLRIATRRCPDRLAVVDETRSMTFAQLDQRSDALAMGLLERGYGPSTTVGTLCRDHCGLIEAMMGAGKIGARLVLLNTGLSARELGEVTGREGVTVVIHDTEFAGALAHLPDSVLPIAADAESGTGTSGTALADLIDRHAGAGRPPRPARPGALIALTGGTTGTPKGAERTVRSPLAAVQFLDRIPLPFEGTTFLAAPLFHGTALSQFLLSLTLGTKTIMRRRFDPEQTMQAIDAHGCTTLVLVPTMLRRILGLGADILDKYDTSTLSVIFCAGSTLPIETGNRAIAQFGPVLYNLYGASEVGVAAVATPWDWIAAPGTVGKPPRSTRVRLYDDHDQPVTRPHIRGTVYVGSALSFEGYSGGGGKKVIDGLLSSGDVGHWDANGRLFVDGRDDDMIVSGGENVFPGEVEELLYAHPDIDEAAIVAVPDDDFGQRLAAFVVARPDTTLDADTVRQYVKDNLARFKVPRDVTFIDKLPRTPSGKLLRRELT